MGLAFVVPVRASIRGFQADFVGDHGSMSGTTLTVQKEAKRGAPPDVLGVLEGV